MGLFAYLRVGLCAVGFSFAQPLALAHAPATDDLAVALALPVASNLVGARDAKRFAWVENAGGVRNLWTGAVGEKARRVTAFTKDDGQPLYEPALSPDGARLAFVRGGDEEFPDEALPNAGSAAQAPAQQVFVAVATGGAPVLVGEGHSPVFAPSGERLAFTRKGEIWIAERSGAPRRVATVRGEVRRLVWSPDGARLLFVDHRDDRSFVAVFDLASAQLRYVDPGLGFSVEPLFSPDGRRIAFIHYVEPPASAHVGAPEKASYWSIRVADVATGASRVLWSAPAGTGGRYAGTRATNLFWSAGGELVFPWERSGWLHAYAIDAASGSAPRELTPGSFEIETFLLDRDGGALIYAANAGDPNRRHIWRRPVRGGAPVRITGGEGIESLPTLGGGALGLIATDARRPAYPVVVTDRLVPLRTDVAALQFAAPEPVLFRAADGVEVHGQLFRAHGPGKHPAIVFVHGGPRRQMLLGFHPSGYYSNAYVMNQHLAAKGYHVLAVNYRSGTGYGLAFRDAAGVGRDGASEYRDILAGGRWLAGREDVEPERIGIWGGSWGGYLTALALARDSALFKAGVNLHGVHTLLKSLPNSLSPDAQAAARQMQWDSSPMSAIDGWRSPVLLIHGDDDRNVDFSQSLLLARELSARNIRYRELTFPNERHSFFRHASWLASLRAAESFFDETLMKKRMPPCETSSSCSRP